MRSVIRFTTALVLVLSLGLHWAVLQTIAWTGMIVTYSRDASFSVAVSRTFDGEHPCKVCKVIKQARNEGKEQQQQQQFKPSSKLDLGLVWQPAPLHFCRDHLSIPAPDAVASVRSHQPPKPPPRAA